MEDDVVLTFSYETDDMHVLEDFGGMGNVLKNNITLNKQVMDAGGYWSYINVGEDNAAVTIPGVFKKSLSREFDGYTASYLITVNEAKLDLTGDLPLTIHDVMSNTLAYISGSLVVVEKDAQGSQRVLKQDVDYSVTYDGTGSQTDASGNSVHVLDITVFDPGPYTYVLSYDATLIVPEGATQGVKYSNYASVTLLGQEFSSDSEDKIYANINISAKAYQLEVYKTTEDGKVLPGATFGLYNQNGGLMASAQTDENGYLLFETDIVNGIILRQHVPYYIQEIDAPEGYVLSDEKHWVYFCDEALDACSYDPKIDGAQRILGEEVGVLYIANKLEVYELPSTGSWGSTLYAVGGFTLAVAGACALAARRKRGEGGGANLP